MCVCLRVCAARAVCVCAISEPACVCCQSISVFPTLKSALKFLLETYFQPEWLEGGVSGGIGLIVTRKAELVGV